MLAAIAFIPIAVAVRIENVELFMALAIVLGLGRWPWLFSISALMKAGPGLSLVYPLQRRWRDLGLAIAVGGGITVVSFLVAPHLWSEWLGAITQVGADMVGNGIHSRSHCGFSAHRARPGPGCRILGQRRGGAPAGLRRDDRQSRPVPAGIVILAAVIPIWQAGDPEGLAGRQQARGAGQVTLQRPALDGRR